MVKLTLVIAATLGAVSAAQAQFHSDRLSSDHLSVMAPSARVNGAPGDMRIVETSCPSLPMVDARRRILNIAAMTTPYSLDSVVSAGVTSGVLELNGGRAEELGIEPGDLVEW